MSDSIRDIEPTLASNGRPVAVGIPGYILPTDLNGKLFLKYERDVKSIAVEPKSPIVIRKGSPTPGGWKSYELRGRTWGGSRLTITYADGLTQTIQYFVTKPATEVVSDMGRFLTTKQWFVDPDDPFHRSPSVMTYDREANNIVKQDSPRLDSGPER